MLLLSICAFTSLLLFEEVYSLMHNKAFPQLRHHVTSLGMQIAHFPMQYELNKHAYKMPAFAARIKIFSSTTALELERNLTNPCMCYTNK